MYFSSRFGYKHYAPSLHNTIRTGWTCQTVAIKLPTSLDLSQ